MTERKKALLDTEPGEEERDVKRIYNGLFIFDFIKDIVFMIFKR